MNLIGAIPNVQLRRSRRSDAAPLAKLMKLQDFAAEGIPSSDTFGVSRTEDFLHLIETSFLSITAVSAAATHHILGFVALGIAPHAVDGASNAWSHEAVGQASGTDGGAASADAAHALPCNTLWLNMLLTPPSSVFLSSQNFSRDAPAESAPPTAEAAPVFTAEQLATALLVAAFENLPRIDHIFTVLHDRGARDRLPLNHLVESVPLKTGSIGTPAEVLCIARSKLLTPLHLRSARVEDYDDLVPFLIERVGVITEVPPDLYLEELLQHQDAAHKVVVVENQDTHQLVGYACAHALEMEEQQLLARQYSTSMFNKFRPTGLQKHSDDSSSHARANTFLIDLFYLNPKYDCFAEADVLPYLFAQFPQYEFALILLSHSIEEPPFLRSFEYLPVHRYQPRNSHGETLPVPPGLWACCRHGLLPAEVAPIHASTAASDVKQLLSACAMLPNYSNEMAARLSDDIRIFREGTGASDPPAALELDAGVVPLQMTSASALVGLASVRRLTIRDVYALRANHRVDDYIAFNSRCGPNYEATDITLAPAEGSAKFFSSEMRAVLIRTMAVHPAFRASIRFFVREVLRFSRVDVAVVLSTAERPSFALLLPEMIAVPPRRVVEAPAGTTTRTAAQDGDDVLAPDVNDHALAALFISTARSLGDEKKRVNTRITVVGAGVTGLCFLYRLLTIPYVRFTNLTLISTDGLPPHPNQRKRQWRADGMELLEREHVMLHLGNPVRVIMGSMTDVERESRVISVDNGAFEPYDYLFLATGRQYIIPPVIRRLQQQEGHPISSGVVPLTGELEEDQVRQRIVEMDHSGQHMANILVYGSGLDAFATTTTLIGLGFSPQRVVVCCPSSQTDACVHEASHQATLMLLRMMGVNILQGYEVSCLEYDEDNNLSMVLVTPTSHEAKVGEAVELSVALIVCVEDKDVDSRVLATLNRRSIVFDGRVIVERNYRTTDPFIFAAGPVAMFTRRYGDAPSFEHFNARSVGEHVATVLLAVLGFDEFARATAAEVDHSRKEDLEQSTQHRRSTSDDTTLIKRILQESGSKRFGKTDKQPTSAADADASQQADEDGVSAVVEQLPVYAAPIVRRVHLPDGYQYFTVHCVDFRADVCDCLDCSNLDLKRMYSLDGGETSAGDAAANGSSSRGSVARERQELMAIYVNRLRQRIDAIVYFGNGQPELHNYLALIGYPESVLHLMFRYREAESMAQQSPGTSSAALAAAGLTTTSLNGKLDLIRYLRLPYLQVVFSDKFAIFMRQLQERMRQHESAQQAHAEWLHATPAAKQSREAEVAACTAHLARERSAFRKQVQLELIKFLHEQKDVQPQILFLPSIKDVVKEST